MSRPALRVLLPACILFAAAYAQSPLFSSNQNTYFLTGLARAGYGYLAGDWMAGQTDPIPVFSFIVYVVHAYGGDWMFHALFGVLAAVFAASLAVIAARPRDMLAHAPQLAVLFVLLTLLFCPWLLDPLVGMLPHSVRIELALQRVSIMATIGMAEQHVFGRVLQPSMFGVLLVCSIACFIHGRELAAVVCAVIAATVHPTYVLHAGILTAAFMIVLVVEGRMRRALVVGGLAALLILPIVLYVATAFRAGSRELLAAAQAILVEERISHHARPATWFSRREYLQLAIVAAGLLASFRSRRLFMVLAISAAASAGLTLLQLATGSRTLALLFPWRPSSWLVPACSAILLGAAAAGLVRLIERVATTTSSAAAATSARRARLATVGVAAACLALSAVAGARRTIATARAEPPDLATHLRAAGGPGQTYLVPTDDEDFRLDTGLPIFVDWKSHPYRADEVAEWHDRLYLAYDFYGAGNSADAAAALDAIRQHATITHVVVPVGDEHLLDSVPAVLTYRGSTRVVARLTPVTAEAR